LIGVEVVPLVYIFEYHACGFPLCEAFAVGICDDEGGLEFFPELFHH
jgi:hypothetical protein